MANNNDDNIQPEVQLEIDSISFDTGLGGLNNKKTFTLRMLGRPLSETEMVAIAGALCQSTQVERVFLRGCLRGSPAEATATFLKKIFMTHPSIKEMNLTTNGIKTGLAEVIGFALKTNTSLLGLYLDSNNIGPDGAEALSEGLKHNKTLQVITLNGNKLGDRGATALAEALRTNKTLEKLYLQDNGVAMIEGKALASALEKSSLKEILLSNNNLQDEGGKAIVQTLVNNKSLTSLHLTSTNIGDETCKALAAALCYNCTLRELELSLNARITDAGATAIENKLKHLNYAVENIGLSNHAGVTEDQVERIHVLCHRNRRLNIFFQQVNQNVPAIPLGVWPRVLETVECKPDFLYALLKTKPEVCREQQHTRRRRRHTQIG